MVRFLFFAACLRQRPKPRKTSSRRLPTSRFPFARFSLFWPGELAVEVADDLRWQRGHVAQMRAADRCQAADQLVRLGVALGSTEELVADRLRVAVSRLPPAPPPPAPPPPPPHPPPPSL